MEVLRDSYAFQQEKEILAFAMAVELFSCLLQEASGLAGKRKSAMFTFHLCKQRVLGHL